MLSETIRSARSIARRHFTYVCQYFPMCHLTSASPEQIHHPVDISKTLQICRDDPSRMLVIDKREEAHSRMAGIDGGDIEQGPEMPGMQKTLAGGSDARIEKACTISSCTTFQAHTSLPNTDNAVFFCSLYEYAWPSVSKTPKELVISSSPG
jgi:hypothetical protein